MSGGDVGRLAVLAATLLAAPAGVAPAQQGGAGPAPAAGPQSAGPGPYQAVPMGNDRVALLDTRDGRLRFCRVEGGPLDPRSTISCSPWSAAGAATGGR